MVMRTENGMQMQSILEMYLRALEAAQQKLDYADDVDLIDAAVFEYKSAMKRLNYLFKTAKRKRIEEELATGG